MSQFTDDSAALWALGIIILLPTLIIGCSELAARLQRRGSPFERTVSLIRTWVLPLLGLWVLVVGAFEVDGEAAGVRWLGTALVFAVSAAALALVLALATVIRQRRRATRTKPLPELLLVLPRLAVLLVAGWVVFVVIWNVDLTRLAAAAGVTSLVVSLALQDTLSGLASGLLLLSDRPFNPGDWIKAGDIEGRVVDVKWRSTRIEDRNGTLLVIPNSKLAGETVFNFDEPTRLYRVTVPVQVAYSNPPNRAREMLLAAAHACEGVLDDPAPAIKVVQVDDPLMGYQAEMWIDDYTIEPRVRSEFGALVWYHSHRMDVPLPSPAYDLYHHDPIQEAADAELSVDRVADRLRQVPLLAELSDDDMHTLAASSRVKVFAVGETVLESGAANRDIYVNWRGLARMVVARSDGEDVDVLDIGAGEVFGLLGRSAQAAAPPAIVAVTDCEMLVIGADAAGVVASRNEELAEAFNRLTLARRRRVERAHRAGVFGLSPSGDGRTGTDGFGEHADEAKEASSP